MTIMHRVRFSIFLSVGTLLSLALAASDSTDKPSLTKHSQRERIVVGPAITVSQAHSSSSHWEVQIAADPTDPKRLIACSKMQGDDHTYLRSWPDDVVIYVSGDGGVNWQTTYESDQHQHYTDPSCVFGPDGS